MEVAWAGGIMEAGNRGVALALLSAFGFSTLPIFGRYADLFGISIVTLLLFRFVLATPLIWVPLAAKGELEVMSGRNLGIGIALGAVGYAAVSYLYLFGVNLTGAGLGAIVLYVYPAMVVVIAVTAGYESVTRKTVGAMVMAILGVALVMFGKPAQVDPLGIAIVLGAAVVYAGYITLSRVVLKTVEARRLTAHVIPAAALSFAIIAAVRGAIQIPASPVQWSLVVGVAILATVIPILTFFEAVSIIGASRTSIVSTSEPVFTVILGVLLLGETLSPTSIAGSAAVLTGVVLIQTD
jgi:drug/metabolite transporter (DMT)-like permease